MRYISPWLIRRSSKDHKRFQVVSFDNKDGKVVIAKEFSSIEKAREFADAANLMISTGGSGSSVKNS